MEKYDGIRSLGCILPGTEVTRIGNDVFFLDKKGDVVRVKLEPEMESE